MQAFVGIRKDLPDTSDSVKYVRELRGGARIGRLTKR